MIKRYNITTKRTYKDRNGEEKAFWPQIGTLTYFPAYQHQEEGYKIELNMFPATQLYIFEQKDGPKRTDPMKPAVLPPGKKAANDTEIEYPTEEINPDDIPF